MDGNNTVDCADWEIIAETLWTGPDDPPSIAACEFAIPTVSHWGVAILTLMLAALGTIAFRRRAA